MLDMKSSLIKTLAHSALGAALVSLQACAADTRDGTADDLAVSGSLEEPGLTAGGPDRTLVAGLTPKQIGWLRKFLAGSADEIKDLLQSADRVDFKRLLPDDVLKLNLVPDGREARELRKRYLASWKNVRAEDSTLLGQDGIRNNVLATWFALQDNAVALQKDGLLQVNDVPKVYTEAVRGSLDDLLRKRIDRAGTSVGGFLSFTTTMMSQGNVERNREFLRILPRFIKNQRRLLATIEMLSGGTPIAQFKGAKLPGGIALELPAGGVIKQLIVELPTTLKEHDFFALWIKQPAWRGASRPTKLEAWKKSLEDAAKALYGRTPDGLDLQATLPSWVKDTNKLYDLVNHGDPDMLAKTIRIVQQAR